MHYVEREARECHDFAKWVSCDRSINTVLELLLRIYDGELDKVLRWHLLRWYWRLEKDVSFWDFAGGRRDDVGARHGWTICEDRVSEKSSFISRRTQAYLTTSSNTSMLSSSDMKQTESAQRGVGKCSLPEKRLQQAKRTNLSGVLQ